MFAYYSSIILNSFSHLLFSKLCQHNLSRPAYCMTQCYRLAQSNNNLSITVTNWYCSVGNARLSWLNPTHTILSTYQANITIYQISVGVRWCWNKQGWILRVLLAVTWRLVNVPGESALANYLDQTVLPLVTECLPNVHFRVQKCYAMLLTAAKLVSA